MSYKELYKELSENLNSLNCEVCDYDFPGYCGYTGKFKASIYISSSLNYQQKYFVLAHEAGHLFYMKKGSIFNWSKKYRTEEEANWFAVQLLRINDIGSDEYWQFYNKIKKRKRKKTWFEI